jgi:hypothetical protein
MIFVKEELGKILKALKAGLLSMQSPKKSEENIEKSHLG